MVFTTRIVFAPRSSNHFYKSGLPSAFTIVPMLGSITFTLIGPKLLSLTNGWLWPFPAESCTGTGGIGFHLNGTPRRGPTSVQNPTTPPLPSTLSSTPTFPTQQRLESPKSVHFHCPATANAFRGDRGAAWWLVTLSRVPQFGGAVPCRTWRVLIYLQCPND